MERWDENILQTFEAVRKALNVLSLHVLEDLSYLPVAIDENFYASIQEKESRLEKREVLVYTLKHLSHSVKLSAQETLSCPGYIGCTPETLALINETNRVKDTFKKAIAYAHEVLKKPPYEPIRDVLAKAGYGVVKLKQVYRHLHYIDYHPRHIGWTKAAHTASTIITYEEAIARLGRSGQGRHIEAQLAKLDLLDRKERLIIHQQVRPYWIVNVASFKKGDKITYQKIRSSLPLFYLHDPNKAEPLLKMGKAERRKSVRSDKLIEDRPYLPSIWAYRYKKANN